MTETSKSKKVIKQVSSILFYVFAGLLVLYILLELFLPNTTIKVFRFKPYVVITESMEPVLNVNDLIIVYNPDIDELDEGDIITFLADIDYDGQKEVITHYIYSIAVNDDNENVYRTIRHDGVVPDTWLLNDEDIIGVYGFRIPQLGRLVSFLKSPFGIVALTVNALVIVGIIVVLKKEKNKQLN